MRKEEGAIDLINCPLFFKSRHPVWQGYRLSLRHRYLSHVDVLIVRLNAIRPGSKGANLRWYSWYACARAESQVLAASITPYGIGEGGRCRESGVITEEDAVTLRIRKLRWER